MGMLSGVVRALGAGATGQVQGEIDAAQMRRMLAMYALQQAKLQGDIAHTSAETQHQQMVNSVGLAGIEGSDANAAYKGKVASAEAWAQLPPKLKQMVLEKQIDFGNAVKLAGINTALDVNYKIPAQANASVAESAVKTGMEQSGSPMTRIAQTMGGTGMSPQEVAQQHPLPQPPSMPGQTPGAQGGSVDSPAAQGNSAPVGPQTGAPRTHRLVHAYGLTPPGAP